MENKHPATCFFYLRPAGSSRLLMCTSWFKMCDLKLLRVGRSRRILELYPEKMLMFFLCAPVNLQPNGVFLFCFFSQDLLVIFWGGDIGPSGIPKFPANKKHTSSLTGQQRLTTRVCKKIRISKNGVNIWPLCEKHVSLVICVVALQLLSFSVGSNIGDA